MLAVESYTFYLYVIKTFWFEPLLRAPMYNLCVYDGVLYKELKSYCTQRHDNRAAVLFLLYGCEVTNKEKRATLLVIGYFKST